MADSGAEFGYMRVVEVFDKDETAHRFMRDDGDGGFAGAVWQMARKVERLEAALREVAPDHAALAGDIIDTD